MVVSTGGVRVVLGDREGEGALLGFLKAPPRELFTTLGEVLGLVTSKMEVNSGPWDEEVWTDMGAENLGEFFSGKEWTGGIKVTVPFPFSHLVQRINSLVSGLGEKGGGPFSYSLAVEREGREMARTTLSIFMGGDITTVVGAGASPGDLLFHSALLRCFFLVWRRVMERGVALLGLLERLGLIIFL